MALELTRFSVKEPKPQRSHKFIDQAVLDEFFPLHYPSDPEFYRLGDIPRYGKTFLGYHSNKQYYYKKKPVKLKDMVRENEKEKAFWIDILSRPMITEVRDFVSEMHISRDLDYYIMANSVHGVDRLNAEIFAFHNIVMDIDCHDEEGENDLPTAWIVEDLSNHLKEDVWDEELFIVPNTEAATTRGLQCWVAINPMTAKQAWKYKLIATWILDKVEDSVNRYKAKTENVSFIKLDRGATMRLCGWFRMPCTWNTKTGVKGSFEILNPVRYDHEELFRKIPKGYMRQRALEGRRGSLTDTMRYAPLSAAERNIILGGTTGMALRATQLIKLRDHRKAQGITDERRDRFCFSLFNTLLADLPKEKAFAFLVDFNNEFLNPLELPDLARMMSTAANIGGYKLTNEWIISELDITREEQDLFGIHPKGAKKGERKGSNYTRDYIRKVRREDRDHRIWDLWQNGYNKSEIARTEKVSRNTVAKVIAAQEAAQELQAQAEVAEELAVMQEVQQAEMQAAVGAEAVTVGKTNRGEVCSKTVPIKYFVPLPPTGGLSTGEGQCINKPPDIPPKGGDPPSSG